MLWQFPIGDGLVVARPDLQGLFLLNGTARQVWDEFSRGAGLEEIAQAFVERYGVTELQARRDVEATLAGWSEGLLSPEPSAAAIPCTSGDLVTGTLHAINCVLNGQAFRVLLDPGDLVEEIAPRLAQSAVPSLPGNLPFVTFSLVNGEDRVLVFRDGVCIAREEKTSGARAILLQEMTGLCAPGRETKAVLHAGACGTASDCVILAGASQAGKSTLCAALMAEGLFCYSDDSAILDCHYRVAGMPFPLMLREASWPVLGPSFMESSRVHLRLGCNVRFLSSNLPANSSPVARPKALVFVDYQPHAQVSLRPLTPFEALLGLRDGGFWVEHDRESIAQFLAWIGQIGCCKLTWSAIGEATKAVKGLLAEC